MRPLFKLLLALLLAGGAIAAGVALRIYEEPAPVEPIRPAESPTTFPRLSVQLARSGGQLLMTNLDGHAWTSCIVDVNAGVPGGGFSHEAGDVGPGAQISMRLTAFERTDGRRFDPDAERVQVVDVHCGTPDGQAHFTGGL